MKKVFVLTALLCAAVLAATGPSTFNILKMPAGSPTPTIDANLTDWPEAYFIDSLHSNDNVYVADAPSIPWTRADFQMGLYAAYDDGKIYYAIKVIADDVLRNCNNSVSQCDNIKINQLGKGTAMYIFPDGTLKPNPSCPWTNGTTFAGTAKPTANGPTQPIYEFWLDKETTAPFGATTFQLSPGSEETDGAYLTYYDQLFVCVGAFGPADKTDYNGNPWDNAQYWPTWVLSATEGPAFISAERNVTSKSALSVTANPNPFTPSTVLSFQSMGAGKLDIYNVAGKLVRSFAVADGSHSQAWDGTDASGRSLSAGVYVARLTAGTRSVETRLFLAR